MTNLDERSSIPKDESLTRKRGLGSIRASTAARRCWQASICGGEKGWGMDRKMKGLSVAWDFSGGWGWNALGWAGCAWW